MTKSGARDRDQPGVPEGPRYHGGNGPPRLHHRQSGDGQVHPSRALPLADAQADRRPRADRRRRPQRPRSDDPLVLQVQTRHHARPHQETAQAVGTRRALQEPRRRRHRRSVDGPGRPHGLRRKISQAQRPAPQKAVRRPPDDPHRRPLPAAARRHRPRERPLRRRRRGPVRITVFLFGRDLRRAGVRLGVRRAGKSLPADRRRVRRPAQRHPQPLDRRGGDRTAQQPLPARILAARRRVLHHPDEHERPGGHAQPREARRPAGPGAPLSGHRRRRVRPRLAPDRGGPRAQARRPGHAPDERPARPLGERDDRPGRQDRQDRREATTSSPSTSRTRAWSTSRRTPGSSSTSSTTPGPTGSRPRRWARSRSTRCGWPGR